MRYEGLINCEVEDIQPPFDEVAEEIGMKNLWVLSEVLGGTSIYIPRTQSLFRIPLEREIIKAYRAGTTYGKLVQEYGLSEKTIRNIVKNG